MNKLTGYKVVLYPVTDLSKGQLERYIEATLGSECVALEMKIEGGEKAPDKKVA